MGNEGVQVVQEPARPDGWVEVPVADLAPAHRNANKGSVARIVQSLQEFGQHRPLVVQKSTSMVIVGNHMLEAAKTLGWETMFAIYVDDDDRTALRRAIADNATRDHAQWDKDELAVQLKEVGEVPGFSQFEIDRLVGDLERRHKRDDETPIFPVVPRLMEGYDYVVVFASNETDKAWLQEMFQLRREASYQQPNKIGLSRVVTVERYREITGL